MTNSIRIEMRPGRHALSVKAELCIDGRKPSTLRPDSTFGLGRLA